MQHWQKTLPPYHLLVVLGQLHGLAAYMQRPQYVLRYHPVLNTQPNALTLSQLFLPTFAIAVSLLHPLLTAGTTRSRNHAQYASLHPIARHVGHQFLDHNFF